MIYSDGEALYPQGCSFLHLNHRLHSPLEKNMIGRMIQYCKERTESFVDYYPCINNKKRNYTL
jgi:putative transposase